MKGFSISYTYALFDVQHGKSQLNGSHALHLPVIITQVLHCAAIAMSDDVSGSWEQAQINPLLKTKILRGELIL